MASVSDTGHDLERTVHEWRRGDYLISTDRGRVDLAAVHDYLANSSYWAGGITRGIVARSIEHSLVFGVYEGARQAGFARVITDYATFGYIADVFILEPFRGRGLGVWLIEVIVAHPELQQLRRWILATRDAHGLYRKMGFREIPNPERWMVRPGGAITAK